MLFSLKNRKKEDKKQEDKDKKLEDKKKSSGKMDDFNDDLDFANDSPIKKFPDSSGPQPPPRMRKNAGWSEETPGKRSWLRRGSSSKNFLKDSPKNEVFMDSSPVTSDIPVIPDLDDMKEEELSADIAKAPSVAINRIATYQELDTDLTKHSAFQSLDGVDLTLLTKRLLPEHIVKKEDETPWTWDTLFADVSSHLNAAMFHESNETDLPEKFSDHIEK